MGNTLTVVDLLLSGAIALAFLVAGLFFLRFWKESRDRLFLAFALAFWVMAVNRVTLELVPREYEGRPLLFLLRLVAFGLILLAIWDKNRRR